MRPYSMHALATGTLLALMLPSGRDAWRPSTAAPPTSLTPVIVGRFTFGEYFPGRPVPDAMLSLRFGALAPSGRYRADCVGDGHDVLPDSAGRFLVPRTPFPLPVDSAATPTLCVLSRAVVEDHFVQLYTLSVSERLAADTVWLECVVHGDYGSQECKHSTRERLARPWPRRPAG